jgi:hypothetical protein
MYSNLLCFVGEVAMDIRSGFTPRFGKFHSLSPGGVLLESYIRIVVVLSRAHTDFFLHLL